MSDEQPPLTDADLVKQFGKSVDQLRTELAAAQEVVRGMVPAPLDLGMVQTPAPVGLSTASILGQVPTIQTTSAAGTAPPAERSAPPAPMPPLDIGRPTPMPAMMPPLGLSTPLPAPMPVGPAMPTGQPMPWGGAAPALNTAAERLAGMLPLPQPTVQPMPAPPTPPDVPKPQPWSVGGALSGLGHLAVHRYADMVSGTHLGMGITVGHALQAAGMDSMTDHANATAEALGFRPYHAPQAAPGHGGEGLAAALGGGTGQAATPDNTETIDLGREIHETLKLILAELRKAGKADAQQPGIQKDGSLIKSLGKTVMNAAQGPASAPQDGGAGSPDTNAAIMRSLMAFI